MFVRIASTLIAAARATACLNACVVFAHALCWPGTVPVPQQKFMSKLVQALNAGTNCILESPTGTGKTMSLLCAALGWREEFLRRNNYVPPADDAWLRGAEEGAGGIMPPQSVYASRTHGQLAQARGESQVRSLARRGVTHTLRT